MSLAHYMVCSNERICIAMWLNNEDRGVSEPLIMHMEALIFESEHAQSNKEAAPGAVKGSNCGKKS